MPTAALETVHAASPRHGLPTRELHEAVSAKDRKKKKNKKRQRDEISAGSQDKEALSGSENQDELSESRSDSLQLSSSSSSSASSSSPRRTRDPSSDEVSPAVMIRLLKKLMSRVKSIEEQILQLVASIGVGAEAPPGADMPNPETMRKIILEIETLLHDSITRSPPLEEIAETVVTASSPSAVTGPVLSKVFQHMRNSTKPELRMLKSVYKSVFPQSRPMVYDEETDSQTRTFCEALAILSVF